MKALRYVEPDEALITARAAEAWSAHEFKAWWWHSCVDDTIKDHTGFDAMGQAHRGVPVRFSEAYR